MDSLRRIGRKGGRYPIKRDEWGTSARARCFEMFEEKVALPEVSGIVGVPLTTIYTYHSQWKKYPHLEVRLGLLNTGNPKRDHALGLLAQAYGIGKEQIEPILGQPYGLIKGLSNTFIAPLRVALAVGAIGRALGDSNCIFTRSFARTRRAWNRQRCSKRWENEYSRIIE